MKSKQKALALFRCLMLSLVVVLPQATSAKRHIVIEGIDSIPPMEFLDKDGNPTGFNVEIIKAVMERLGYDYTINLGSQDSVIKRFNEGVVDVIPGVENSGVNPMLLNQSNITVLMYISIASRKGDNYSSIADLRGKTVAFMEGANAEKYVRNDTLFDSKVVCFSNPEQAMSDLSAGKYDAVIARFYIARDIIRRYGIDNVVLQPINIPPSEQRIVANDKDLSIEITGELTRMRRDGTYDRIYKKWLVEPDSYARYFYALIVLLVMVLLVVAYVIVRMFRNIRSGRRLLQRERDRLSILMDAGRFEGSEIDIRTMMFTRISPTGEVVSKQTITEALEDVYPKDRLVVLNNIDNARNGGSLDKYGEIVVRMKSPDFDPQKPVYRYYTLFSKELRDEKGNVKLYWVRKDINDAYVTSIELKHYHERMDFALKNTGISQLDYDVPRKSVTVRNGYNVPGEVTIDVSKYLEYLPAFKDVFEIMDKGESQGFSKDVTFCYPGSDEKRYATMMVRAMAYDDDGKVTLYTAIRKDNTELINIQHDLERAKEKAEAADRLKSQFLDNMSHEIRTPLNAIVGFSSLLQEADADEREQYIEIINNGSAQLLSLINDILDMSSIEAGTFEFYPSTFDLVDTFKELALELSKKMTNPDVKLLVDNPYKSCMVTLDERVVKKIVKIFMTNAIKNTQKGYVKMGYSYDGKKNLTISVEDTGIGIDEENFGKIFRRFEKIDTFVQGTGLELSFLRALADRTGDEVGFTSKKGSGSTFYFIIHNCKAIVTM